MVKKKIAQDTLSLLHSDQRVIAILNDTNEYLETHSDIRDRIQDYDWVFRSLFELVPATVENFWSGHVFPIAEAEYEIESSIVLCKLGFYKHAISSLRNVLELGLLSIYWDIDDKSHIDIQNWVKSMESTPFRKTIFARLKTNRNIKDFDDRQKIFEKTAKLYERLSNFSHTKGLGYSSRKLNAHNSNVNSFNEASLIKWLGILHQVVETVTIFHILKYPVGLQDTPIDAKFGLNGPAGGFLNPHQVERIKKLISQEPLSDLQTISDNDPNAVSMAAWVNEQPDITETDFEMQIESQDKTTIEWEGYEHWLKNQKKMYAYDRKKNPEKYAEKLVYFKKMKGWARDNDFLKSPQERESQSA